MVQFIEDVTSRPFPDLVQELIFKPLGMKNSSYICEMSGENEINFAHGHNKNGNVIDNKYCIYPYPSAGGLWSTASDLELAVFTRLGCRLLMYAEASSACRYWSCHCDQC
ncbi:serine hydrolase domain-containing protein [Paenibacillus assamensis]|uniref:serine hydrolase n=1 Tax=Paenibacillus assamensis TaxID=311244 RepID=UPI0012FA4C54